MLPLKPTEIALLRNSVFEKSVWNCWNRKLKIEIIEVLIKNFRGKVATSWNESVFCSIKILLRLEMAYFWEKSGRSHFSNGSKVQLVVHWLKSKEITASITRLTNLAGIKNCALTIHLMKEYWFWNQKVVLFVSEPEIQVFRIIKVVLSF